MDCIHIVISKEKFLICFWRGISIDYLLYSLNWFTTMAAVDISSITFVFPMTFQNTLILHIGKSALKIASY